MTHLKTGQPAPAFSAPDQHGETVTLDSFKGRKLILYFYPKDDTPGCTAESCNLRDNYAALTEQGYEVVGVSPDNEKKHQKFISKYELPFTLIADTDNKVCEDYGVWGKKKFMGREYMGVLRTTFVIDEQGIIEHVIEKVDTANSTEQILGLYA